MKSILTRNLANFTSGLALLIVLILHVVIYNNLRDLIEDNQKSTTRCSFWKDWMRTLEYVAGRAG